MHIVLAGPAAPSDMADLLDSDRPPAGYARTPVDELARAFLEYGLRVSVVTTDSSLDETWEGSGPNLTVFCVPQRARARDRALNLFKQERAMIREIIGDIGPDVIHAHWTYEFALASLSVRRDALVTAHDAPVTVLRQYRDPYRAARLVMAGMVRLRLRHLAVVAPYLGERWRREMHWRGEPIVLPNIAPKLLAGDVARHELHPPRVLTVGNADRRKNIAALVRAWPDVLRTAPDAELHVVGNGLGPNDPLARDAREAGRTSIFFHGQLPRSGVADQLRAATVLAHPSLEECHPVAILEAMQAGVPVIGGDRSGGVPWTLEGGAGELCDVTDPGSLAEAIAELLKDRARRDRLVAAARIRVRDVYSSAQVVQQHLTLYEALCMGSNGMRI